MRERSNYAQEMVAIVGAACRFPGNANTLDAFWTLLASGKDAVTELPPDRFSLERFTTKAAQFGGHAYTKAAGVIEQHNEFDPHFFGISRKEIIAMDPQQRLALELAWEALAHANFATAELRGAEIGVFMGASNMDFSMEGPEDPVAMSAYSMTGTTLGIIANRISYIFDFHGPSMTVDTACSSSLVAVHQACEAIRQGEIPMALAGGVNMLLSPFPFIGFSRARMLSPDGRCKVFDASGNGYVRSEGGGIIVLKALSRAIKDKDNILALVRATGINSDGRTTGIALPNQDAQESLLQKIYTNYDLDPHKLVYVEAHGTGTAAGDPLEAGAIGKVLGKALAGKRPLAVGSVKSNIGHLEPASGIAGLIKSLLVLKHGKIPANLHIKEPNPAIDFDGLNITVPTTMTDLPSAGGDELISINSFGFGGTNAHVVLQKAPQGRRRKSKISSTTLVPPLLLTAKSHGSLKTMAATYAEYLEQASQEEYYNASATLAFNRDHLNIRSLIKAESLEKTIGQLKKLAKEEVDTSLCATGTSLDPVNCQPGGVFVFSGNGSQWMGMGKVLLEKEPAFSAAIRQVDSLLRQYQNWSLIDYITDPEAHKDDFDHTEKSQPLLFAIQIGVVECLKERGILPSAVMGHSVGEVAAAWACGALSLEDAVKVIHYRSIYQASFRDKGGMAVVSLPEAQAREILKEQGGAIEIAAVNAPASLSLSGPVKDLKAFVDYCKKQRIAAKLLQINYPFHTSAMDSFKVELCASLKDIQARRPKIPFFSTAIDSKKTPVLNAEYWWKNVRQPVLFANATKRALAKGFHLFLEIGPSPVLRSYLRDIFKQEQQSSYIGSTLARNKDDATELEQAWRKAWLHGWGVQWKQYFPHAYIKADLPTYPWDREVLWEEYTSESRIFKSPPRCHPLLGWPLPGKTPVYENTLHLADYAWLEDHVAGTNVLYPAAAFIETMLAAARQIYPHTQQEIEWIAIFRPLALSQDSPKSTKISVDKEDGGLLFEGRPYASQENWSLYARGRIAAAADSPALPRFDLSQPEAFGLAVSNTMLYETAKRFSLNYGPAFQTVEKAWLRADTAKQEILARLKAGNSQSVENMIIAPPLMDGAFQTLFMLLGTVDASASSTYLPSVVERVTLFDAGLPHYAYARLERISPRSVVASFQLLDETGNTLVYLRNCRFRRAAWLEHELKRPRPYVMEFTVSQHPTLPSPAPSITTGELSTDLATVLQQELAKQTQTDSAIDPYLLLQFATLNAMYETVAASLGKQERHDGFTLDTLMQSGRLAPAQEAWCIRMLEHLQKAELAVRNGEEWQLKQQEERPDATLLWRTLVSSSSCHQPEASLLAHIVNQGQTILQYDETDPESQLLPPSLADAYFLNSAALQPFARLIRRCVRKLLQASKTDVPIHILQVARNTEAVLSHVIPVLGNANCNYVVAEKDASTAETRSLLFNHHPAVSFIGLDTEKPDVSHHDKYHLILAHQHTHGRLNSAAALSGLHAMLAPGGLLCFVEHAPSLFTDFTFGACPSWWAASSDLKHPVSLMQTQQYWQHRLEEAGFMEICPLPEDTGESPAFVLLARKGQECHTTNLPVSPTQMDEASAEATAPVSRPVVWLMVGNEAESESAHVIQTMATALEKEGQNIRVLRHERDLDVTSQADWHTLFSSLPSEEEYRLIYTCAYDSRQDVDTDTLNAICTLGLNGLSAVAKAWEQSRPALHLWVVTGGGWDNQTTSSRPVPSQGATCGFSRVMMNEIRSLPIYLVDVHGPSASFDLALPLLLPEFLHPTDETEIIVEGGKRFIPRMDCLQAPQASIGSPAAGAVLTFDEPGRLQNLYWKEMAVPIPGDGEVCVAVKYTGLNFRDVMWSMGLLQDEALENGFSGPTMGIECSGVIVAVGKQVENWSVGDEVVCFAPACFSSHVLTKATALARKPENLSFAEAATLPVAFITAWYSLKHQARMRPGEKVLIHGAAGGVGLAAVQIASLLGLEVFATAGAPEKHAFLRQLGVKHIFSSRSLAFTEQVTEATNGEGVDAVLNSLAGEFIAAGINTLKPFGRFIELGKRDFYGDTPMRLRPFSNNLSYFGVDVDQLITHQPLLAQELFAELMDLFAQRKLVPLPHTIYPTVKTVDAFQAMQQSSHIGKLVVSMENAPSLAKRAEKGLTALRLLPGATYLISGGTSGFGLATASHLVSRGARHLLLLSRSGLKDEAAKAVVAALQEQGCEVVVGKVDVADKESLKRALKRYGKTMPAVRGIIHAAAILDDGMIQGLTPERIAATMGAKGLGAWNLHTLTKNLDLDFFVLYSSATTPFGNPGQANYVAANCLLESLNAWRKKQGLPSQVIGWGPIGDTGMLTRNPKAQQLLLKVLGISAITSAQAMQWLEHVLAEDVPSSHYFGLDWHNRSDLPILRNPRFSRLRPKQLSSQGSDGPSLDDIRACAPQEAIAMITGILLEEIAHVLRMPKDKLTADAPLVGMGMDSLTSVELSLAVEQRFELAGYNLPLSEKTTALSLAESLYAILMGGESGAEDADSLAVKQAVHAMTEKHGVADDSQLEDAILAEMQEK